MSQSDFQPMSTELKLFLLGIVIACLVALQALDHEAQRVYERCVRAGNPVERCDDLLEP